MQQAINNFGVMKHSDDKMGLIQTAMDCDRYETRPPNTTCRTTFTKRFTTSGLWDVNDTGLVFEKVSTRSGLLLWLPWRGLDSFKRMGLVPKNATRTLSNRTWTWTKETAIPYGSDQGQIKVSPDAAKDFSFTRMIAAKLSCSSTAIAIGQTTITGQVAWGVLQDTRDVSQSDQGAFVADAIVQQSMTAKDAAINQQLADGWMGVLGSDVEMDFRVPDRNNYFSRNAGVEKFILVDDAGVTTASLAAGSKDYITAHHISPWGVNYVDTQVLPAINWVQLESANINVFGKVKFVCYVEGTLVAKGTPVLDIGYTIRVACQDTYASCNKDGSVTYNQGPRCERDITLLNNQIVGSNTQVQFEHTVQNRTDLYGSDSIYIGTAFYTQGMNTTDAVVTLKVSNFHVHMFAEDIYTQGELGPARVVRYDGVGEEQQMAVSGSLLVECVPEGTIAPYVTTSDKAQPKTLSVNMIPFLASVFNGNTAFRRNWNIAAYRDFVANVVPSLSLENFAALGGPDLSNAAVAAGLFSDLGGALGGIFGDTGRNIGSAIGTAGDVGMHLFGASGQYGAGGQFGAPQFGASGQFAGKRSAYQY